MTNKYLPRNIERLHLMSLYESKESNGKISLIDLLNETIEVNGIESQLTFTNLVSAICRGGWSASIGENDFKASLIVESYIHLLCESEVSKVNSSLKNPQRIRAILQSYARNISTLATKETLRNDVIGNHQNISQATFYSYVNALEQLFVIKDIPAWTPAIRSKSAIRATAKRGFIDPSLAVSLLGLSPEDLLQDMNTLGFLFESLVIRDLRIYSQSMGGYISYYHDRYGLECDAVLHLKDGKYVLIEIKLGSFEIDEGSKNLLKLKELITQHGMKKPSLFMVITGGKMAYQREDGVYVIPIGCLKE